MPQVARVDGILRHQVTPGKQRIAEIHVAATNVGDGLAHERRNGGRARATVAGPTAAVLATIATAHRHCAHTRRSVSGFVLLQRD